MFRPYYQDEWVTIYHGDCREILPTLEKVDLVITSPPFNLYKRWWDSGAHGLQGHRALQEKFTNDWYPDELPEAEYQSQQKLMLDMAYKNCRGSVCYNHRVRYAFKRAGRSFHPMEWLSEFPLWVEIIWDRGGGVAFNSRRPIISDERIFVLGKPKAYHSEKLTTVWRFPPDRDAPEHPCAFPLEMPRRLISMFTDPGDTVLDYYIGSGTTAVAAKKLNRKCIGIEIEEKYCEIAAKRCSQSVMRLDV